MSRKRRERVGKLAPRYSFALNPYPDERFSRCPKCKRTMNRRKFPLFIHIDGWGPLSLGKTCRYCPRCELIIAHQDELEGELAHFFQQHQPDLLGNDYLVLGTLPLKVWKQGLTGKPATLEKILEHVSDFQKHFDLEVTGGWYLPGAADRGRSGT